MNPAAPAPEERGAASRIVRNAASMLIGDAAGEVLVGYAMVLAAISLGPSGFGVLSEGQAFMEPFDALAALGMGSVAITMAAHRGGCDGTLRGTVWGMRMVAAAVTPLLAVLAALVTGRQQLLPLLGVLGVATLIAPTTMVSNLPFQYEQSVHRRMAIPSLVGAVRLATAYLASRFLNRPVGYQLSALSAVVSGALLMRTWARRYYPEPLRFDRRVAMSLLRLGWPAAVFEFVVMCYTRASYFFLHGAGSLVLGQYAAADRLTRPIMAVSGAIFASALPTFARLAEKGEIRTLRSAYRRSVMRVVTGLLPVVACAWFAAPSIIGAAAPEYGGAIWPFRILATGTIFMFLNQLSSTYMVALGRLRIIMTIAIANLLTYVMLAIALVPRFGARGAALAILIVEALNSVVQLGIVRYLLRASLRHASGAESAS